MKSSKILLPVLLFGVLLVAGCIKEGADRGEKATFEEITEQEQVIIEEGGIVIEASEFEFSPDSITIIGKEKKKLLLKNTGNEAHNLAIPALGIQTKTINPGEINIVELYSDNSGKYIFYCNIPGHQEQGMQGTINVWPKATSE